MKLLVLAYHSHHMSGNEYPGNDHVALASDLETITEAGAQIVPLRRIAEQVRAPGSVETEGATLVGISFDDGAMFDYEDFDHPEFGPQRSFLNVIRDFRARHGSAIQPHLHATSFVIASPGARQELEAAEECGFPDLPDWFTDRWWKDAAATGLFEIGNHSWDHVHPAPGTIVTTTNARGNFGLVDNYIDADREIRAASEFIGTRLEGACELFAFPYGHVNDYLVNDYLPAHADEHGLTAAFGTSGRRIEAGDSVWNIPRLVCGHDWKTSAELRELLGS